MNNLMNFEEVSILELIKHLDPQADACSHWQDDGDMNSPTSGIRFSKRRPQHPGDLGRPRGAPATSAPDANHVGWGGTGGDKPLDALVACACTKLHLVSACHREFPAHSLMRSHEDRTKDLEVSHNYLEWLKNSSVYRNLIFTKR